MKKLALLIVFTLLITTLTMLSVSAVDPLVVESIAEGKNILTANVVADSVVGTETFANETAANLFDGDTATKFCSDKLPAEITWKMDAAYAVDYYLIATANDNAEYNGRNPETWILSGSNDNATWTVIDDGAEAELAEVNFTYFMFPVATPAAYEYYKLEIPSALSGCLQFSEVVLCGAVPAAAVEETVAAPAETAAPAAEVVVAAPQTADAFAVIVAVLAVAGTGIIISKKSR
ncbi:MAG: discoidin domain-containing protein [Eubacteriales bacterium]